MTTPSFEPPPIEPHKALPPIPSLPPVRTVPPVVRQVEANYYRRLVASVGLSILLNLLLLALVSSTGLSRLVRLSERPKRPAQRETPKLVLVPKPQLPPEPEFPRPKTFLETDLIQQSLAKPKNAEFYSEYNTVATQVAPSPVKPGDLPKTDGQNTKSMATETVRPGPRTPPAPAAPAPVSPPAAAQPPPSPKAAPPQPPSPPTPPSPPVPQTQVPPVTKEGDFALLRREPPPKPQPRVEATPKPSESTSPQASVAPRAPSVPPTPAVPTTEREVLAAKSKLDGGVGRTGRATAFNSEESPFASYDKRVIAKIGANWNFLIESRFYGETVGQVVVSFKILGSGRVSEVHIEQNSANAVLAGYCVQAIEKSAPFGPFPEALRVIVGDSRDATVTFNY